MTTTKKGAIIYNDHRNEWELWYRSQVIVHGTDMDGILEWADQHGYDAQVIER